MAYKETEFHGKDARVEKNDVAISFTGDYTWNATCAFADSSAQGDDWTKSTAGQGSWSGSFNGSFVAGNTQQKALMDNIVTATPGVLLTDMKFLLDVSTNAFTGDIYIDSMNVTASKDDTCKVSWNFHGNGAPTLTDAA